MTSTGVIAGKADTLDVITEVIWSRLYNAEPDGVAKSRKFAHAIWASLCNEGLVAGQQPTTGEGALAAVRKSTAEGKTPYRGASHHVAQALVLLELPTVHRHVLEYLIPDRPGGSKDAKTAVVKAACRRFNVWGWINRDDSGLINVLDPASLAEWFEIAQDPSDQSRFRTLDLAGAIQRMNAEIRSGNTDDLRQRELAALQRLMQTAPGAITNERGHVRLVAKPSMI